MLNFLFVLHGSHFWGMESCFTLFIPVLKIHLGAAILECSYRALQRVATVRKSSLTPQLCFGFKSLPPAPREPLAAQRARSVRREPFPAGDRPGPGPGPAVPRQPLSSGGGPLKSSSRLKPFGAPFFPLSGMLFHVLFSTSRRNPKSRTLSKKCLRQGILAQR